MNPTATHKGIEYTAAWDCDHVIVWTNRSLKQLRFDAKGVAALGRNPLHAALAIAPSTAPELWS